MWRPLALVVGSIPILWISRGSLRHRDAHGFYRYFAFEAILGVIVLSIPTWFRDPLSQRQLCSWVLLLSSLLLAAHGFRMLRELGDPDLNIQDGTRLGVEKTTRLVQSGAYRYIRHPLYASLLALAWGAFLKAPSWLAAVLAVVATGALYLTARVEERENVRNLGAAYAEYMRRTRMFVPFIV